MRAFSDVEKCPVRNVIGRFSNKWALLILLLLDENDTLRFSTLRRTIGNISQRMLSVTLRSLEADGLITRKAYVSSSPRVEYALSPMGKTLTPHLQSLVDWASGNMKAIVRKRKLTMKKRGEEV